jgi:O-methyltransferase involved in polyketide biosynthesis
MSTRDYSTISPSARALLAMRAQSDLPFAKQAADVVLGADAVATEHARLQTLAGSSLRLRHFVQRYRSIDALLVTHPATTIVELGAGLSMRGLALVRDQRVTYVDTDLPEIMATKRSLIDELGVPVTGELRLRDLDALDARAFRAIIDELPPGPITLVNEGLLMYLDDSEKHRLAANILDALAARGGMWITADAYVRTPDGAPRIGQDERLRAFLTQHNVEANKFESFSAAEQFFVEAGFAIVERVAPRIDPIRETWVLTRRV